MESLCSTWSVSELNKWPHSLFLTALQSLLTALSHNVVFDFDCIETWVPFLYYCRQPDTCNKFHKILRSRDSLLVERWTCDQKVASSSPRRNSRWIFFSRINFLLIKCPLPPTQTHVTAVAHKRPWSFYQKCRWQVTPEHIYDPEPKKSLNFHLHNSDAYKT